ncbi:hypothetical protein A0J61_01164 [Choanephora cucurbitarum]|uniref:Subtilisin inhibitor domain-containing protein n=1 Tax=Choanephora cucurbitarum TaxID=101091 RepID=A0A1C7NNR9_9FUNG|nr:hypothetical protein A0J61_01164 [Choanephora cucurbitarum]
MAAAVKHSSSPRVSLKINLSGHLLTPQSYKLTCEPLGGNHPEPRKACDALNTIGGDLDSYHKIPFPCRDTTLPAVQVDVMGTYYDRPIQFTKIHANYKCSRAVMNGFYP